MNYTKADAPYAYKHPRPALAVDCVVFGWDGAGLNVLLIRRGQEPFKGEWAFPGGFVQMDEDLETAAQRELQEETGLQGMFLEQLYTFGAPERDPRGRIVSVAYYALVHAGKYAGLQAATDASDARWFPEMQLPPLAFDHQQILQVARDRLEAKVRYQPIGFELLPPKFSLRQLQALYECILQQQLDRRNFRKKLMTMDLLVELGEVEQGKATRGGQLYSFSPPKYQELQRSGTQFKL